MVPQSTTISKTYITMTRSVVYVHDFVFIIIGSFVEFRRLYSRVACFSMPKLGPTIGNEKMELSC